MASNFLEFFKVISNNLEFFLWSCWYIQNIAVPLNSFFNPLNFIYKHFLHFLCVSLCSFDINSALFILTYLMPSSLYFSISPIQFSIIWRRISKFAMYERIILNLFRLLYNFKIKYFCFIKKLTKRSIE